MDDDEHIVGGKMLYELNTDHNFIYIFENGKGLKVGLSCYEAKSKRKKISGAYSSASPLAGVVYEDKIKDVFIRSDAGRGMLIKSSLIPEKATRTASGVQIMKLPKKNIKVDLATDRIEEIGQDALKCKKLAIPSTGSPLEQLTFNF
jgi:DNA gyrase subunit A